MASGGKREGCGRPSVGSDKFRDNKRKWLIGRGVAPATAAEILEVHNERAIWQRILKCKDMRVQLDAIKFLTMMRDGKPAQRISVTSTNINLTAEEISRAKVIVGEILGSPNLGLREHDNDTTCLEIESHVADAPQLPQSDNDTVCSGNLNMETQSIETERLEKHNAAGEGRGAK